MLESRGIQETWSKGTPTSAKMAGSCKIIRIASESIAAGLSVLCTLRGSPLGQNFPNSIDKRNHWIPRVRAKCYRMNDKGS